MITDKIKSYIQNSVCLVTGGAGFIGSNLVGELLLLDAKKVIVLDDLSTGYFKNIEEFNTNVKFVFVEASINDYDACLKAFEGVDIVFQMAALGSVPRSIDNPIATNATNVTGFLNVLNAAKESKVSKVVYSSSSSIYGDDEHLPKVEKFTGNPLSPYAVTKKANELYARTFTDLYGMDIIGLRYFNVFGPKQSTQGAYAAVIPIFIQNLLKNEVCYINGDGEISRDFTYVKNVVEANICAAFAQVDNKDRIYNVAMGDQLSLNELYSILESNIQSGLKAVHREHRTGDILSSQANIDKAKADLGYYPKYSLEEGMAITIEWNKKNINS
jgi:UDP-N-acetylglucosamine 4-epimerase